MNRATITAESIDADEGSAAPAGWVEKLVPPLVVTAISVAGVLASLMQPRAETPQPVPALTHAIAGALQVAPPRAGRG